MYRHFYETFEIVSASGPRSWFVTQLLLHLATLLVAQSAKCFNSVNVSASSINTIFTVIVVTIPRLLLIVNQLVRARHPLSCEGAVENLQMAVK